MQTVTHFHSLLYMSVKLIIKFLLINNFSLLSKALGMERPPPMFPKTGPPFKQTPISIRNGDIRQWSCTLICGGTGHELLVAVNN